MIVRDAAAEDIDEIIDLIEQRRVQLESWQPRFWRKATNSADMSRGFLPVLIDADDTIFLAACRNEQVVGCLHAKQTFVPPVYDPGGVSWMLDDFCVWDGEWAVIGKPLLTELRQRIETIAPGQLILSAPNADKAQVEFLVSEGLVPTSMWWSAPTGSA